MDAAEVEPAQRLNPRYALNNPGLSNPQLRKLDEAELSATLNHCDILPLIREIPLSRLQRATGLSLRYVSLIRRGERTPHPRHWQTLLGSAEP